jgi:hypothetical protein
MLSILLLEQDLISNLFMLIKVSHIVLETDLWKALMIHIEASMPSVQKEFIICHYNSSLVDVFKML